MAEERNIIFNVGIQSEDAVAGLNQIDQGLKKVDQSVDKIGADSGELQSFESKLADINKKVSSGELNFQQLRKTIKDYQGIAFEAGRTSPVGQQALADAANLQDRLTDLDNEVKRLAHDGANMQAAMQLGQGILAGFTAFKGVTAALGIENEDLMKTMTQLQGASSALMAVEQLRATLEKESFLMIKLKTMATKGLTVDTEKSTLAQIRHGIATKTVSAITKTYTVVQKALNVAMKANPIGFLILAITSLIALFVLLYKNVQSVIDAFIALGQWLGLISDEEAELEAQRVAANEEAEKRHKENIARLKGERDAQKKVLEQIEKRKKLNQETTDLELLQAKARGAGEKELFEIQKKANDLKLEMAKQELQAKAEIMRISREMAQAEYDRYKTFLETQALQSGFTEAQIAKELKQLEEAKARYEEEEAAQIAANERALATLEANNTIFIKDHIKKQSDKAEKLKDIDDKAAAQRIKDAEKENSELEKIADDLFNRKLSARKRLDKMIRDENADEFQLQINQLRDQYAKELELLDDSIAEEAALKIKLEQALQKEIAAIRKAAGEADDEATRLKIESQIQQAIDLSNVGLEKLNEINDILNEIGERRLQKIQDQRDADLDSLEKQKKKELNIEGKTAQQKAQIEHKFAMQEFKIKKQAAEAEDKIARRQFQRNKALKIAEIAINTAAAVMQALASFPPPASFVVAGVTGAIGIAQAAMVASTKFQGTSGGIQPPNFTMPNVNDDTGADGNNNGANNRTTSDDGTNVDDLINGPQTIMISQVEINETRDEMANVQDVATI